uniref:Dynein regulatory complex protein 10 n=1 Tax=Glossina austeni TaxID=7395 RepID=A0A1A9VD26_GLOAU
MEKRYSSARWLGIDETPSFNWKKREEILCHLIEALNENLKIALLIPDILENPQTISHCLTDSKYKQAIELINDFLRDKEKCPPEEIPTHLDSATNSLIDYFINNSGILHYIPKVVKKLKPSQLKLLSYLEMIKDLAGENLSKTALAAMKFKSNINQTQDSAEDLENYIEKKRKFRTKRLFAIIAEFAQRTKLALLLPIIVENYQKLKIYLSGTKYEFVSDLIQDFHANKDKAEYAEMPKYIDRDSDKIIETILANHEIVKYLPRKWFDNLSPGEFKLFKCLDDTINIAKIRFCRGSLQELDIQQVAQEFYDKNQDMIAETKYLEQKLRNKRVTTFWKKIAREVVVHQLGERMQSEAISFAINFQTETDSITRQIKKARQLHALTEKELEDQNQIAKKAYETSLRHNSKIEKIAAAEHRKLTIILESLIEKYDKMMFEKLSETMSLSEAYKAIKKSTKNVEEEYNRVKDLHYELVIKRDPDYYSSRVDVFKFVRAVAIIQRWYRSVAGEKNLLQKIPSEKAPTKKGKTTRMKTERVVRRSKS